MKDFQILCKLGEGSFSQVFKVKRLSDGLEYALKKVKIGQLKPKEQQNALNEVRILASLNDNFIVGYKEAFIEDITQSLCIIMEFANGGDLQKKINDHIKNKTYFPEYEVWKAFVHMTKGLRVLHEMTILHRDLKCANVFMTKGGVYKLGDLNVSKISQNQMVYTQTGTPYYASPEVWRDEPYDYKSDIWSLGCVVYEMCALKPPFRASDMEGLYKKVQKGSFEKLPNRYSKELQQIITLCLQVNPSSRPSCNQLLEHSLVIKNMPNDSSKRPSSAKVQSNPSLLKTILFPKNLSQLKGKLPKSNYEQLNLDGDEETQEDFSPFKGGAGGIRVAPQSAQPSKRQANVLSSQFGVQIQSEKVQQQVQQQQLIKPKQQLQVEELRGGILGQLKEQELGISRQDTPDQKNLVIKKESSQDKIKSQLLYSGQDRQQVQVSQNQRNIQLEQFEQKQRLLQQEKERQVALAKEEEEKEKERDFRQKQEKEIIYSYQLKGQIGGGGQIPKRPQPQKRPYSGIVSTQEQVMNNNSGSSNILRDKRNPYRPAQIQTNALQNQVIPLQQLSRVQSTQNNSNSNYQNQNTRQQHQSRPISAQQDFLQQRGLQQGRLNSAQQGGGGQRLSQNQQNYSKEDQMLKMMQEKQIQREKALQELREQKALLQKYQQQILPNPLLNGNAGNEQSTKYPYGQLKIENPIQEARKMMLNSRVNQRIQSAKALLQPTAFSKQLENDKPRENLKDIFMSPQAAAGIYNYEQFNSIAVQKNPKYLLNEQKAKQQQLLAIKQNLHNQEENFNKMPAINQKRNLQIKSNHNLPKIQSPSNMTPSGLMSNNGYGYGSRQQRPNQSNINGSPSLKPSWWG